MASIPVKDLPNRMLEPHELALPSTYQRASRPDRQESRFRQKDAQQDDPIQGTSQQCYETRHRQCM
jgi:hypothetical protein